LAAGFFAADFFLGAAFFFAAGFFSGIGMVIAPWPVCCAAAGIESEESTNALPARYSDFLTIILRRTGSAGEPSDLQADRQRLMLVRVVVLGTMLLHVMPGMFLAGHVLAAAFLAFRLHLLAAIFLGRWRSLRMGDCRKRDRQGERGQNLVHFLSP
jgi:hypothetical protein